MATIKPYASLCSYARSCGEYYIRLNNVAARLLGDKQWVRVGKTTDNKYIVITPVDNGEEMNMCRKVVTREKDRSAAHIFVSAWVTNGFFDASWFGGKRYKIKKDRNGRIYICLNERME